MKERIYSRPRLLDKSRALYERARKRDPSLPPLLSTAGRVEAKGAVRVVLPTPGGKAVVVATPVGGWRFAIEYVDHLPAALADAKAAVAQPAATIADQAKLDYDALLDLFVGLERRVCAFEAKHRFPDNHVVHLNVAAE
jgi:hypothetical protein